MLNFNTSGAEECGIWVRPGSTARHSIRHRPHSQVQSHIRKEEFVNAQKVSSIPFHGTAEQEAQLKAVIEENKHDKSMLMHVMQQAQQIYGYLPFEVQVMIADGMNLPLEKVYGVSTFYAQFALSPKGTYTSRFPCTACYVKGAQEVLDKVCEMLQCGPEECTEDGRFSVTACRCIGAAALPPS